MDFIVELPKSKDMTIIMVVVDRLTKMAHFIPAEMFTNFFPLIFMSFLLVPILGYMFVRNFQRLETEHIRMKDTERNVLDALGIDKKRLWNSSTLRKKATSRASAHISAPNSASPTRVPTSGQP